MEVPDIQDSSESPFQDALAMYAPACRNSNGPSDFADLGQICAYWHQSLVPCACVGLCYLSVDSQRKGTSRRQISNSFFYWTGDALPGANMLRQLPMLDMLAMASVSVEAPTVMELVALAGDIVQASPPLLLPAAVTTVMPAAEAASMASFCRWGFDGVALVIISPDFAGEICEHTSCMWPPCPNAALNAADTDLHLPMQRSLVQQLTC